MLDDLAAQIRSDVRNRVPVDERESESVRAFITHMASLSEPFSETADPTHITASALVVNNDRSRVVLHKHKRLGLWLQPGGHIEPGERPWDGALREAVEETGLPCRLAAPTLIHVDVHPGPRGHTHLDLRYLVIAEDVEPAPGEGESPDVAWFTWPEAIALADGGLIGLLRAAQPTPG